MWRKRLGYLFWRIGKFIILILYQSEAMFTLTLNNVDKRVI